MHLLQSDTLEILYIKVFYLAETKSKVEILKFKGINSILTWLSTIYEIRLYMNIYMKFDYLLTHHKIC